MERLQTAGGRSSSDGGDFGNRDGHAPRSDGVKRYLTGPAKSMFEFKLRLVREENHTTEFLRVLRWMSKVGPVSHENHMCSFSIP